MNIKFYILTFLIGCTSILQAQNVKFTASASSTEVATGEQFEIVFTVNGDANRFTPPDLSAFQLAGGPNQSQSMESINGVTSSSTSFSYILVPAKTGEFTIGPASIMVGGKRLTSNTLKIKVVKGNAVQQQGRRGRGQAAQQDAGTPVSQADIANSLFMRAAVDKDNVYQGQQLTLTYRIYTNVGIVQSQVTKLPDLTGFWNQDVKTDPRQPAIWKTEKYKGAPYHVADIKQIILFPEHAGNITVDPFEMSFVARVPSPAHDIMEQFFGNSTQDVKYNGKSLPLTVHVKPLPEAGKPPSFTGAVGKFSIEASIDKEHLKANEALNYKVTVTGSGNIKLLKNINAVFPADFEKYDPKITDTVTELVSGVSGTRFYNYLLIPRHQGDYTIDPIKFSYFNPATGRYTNLETKAFHVQVDKGKTETNVTALAGADKQDVKLLGKDIRYIKTGDNELRQQGDRFFGSTAFLLLLLLGPLLTLITYIAYKMREKANSDVVKVRSRRASRVAAKHLANAKKQLKAHNTQALYEAIFKGLYGYLSDKLNISSADLNKETIAEALKARSISDQLTDELLQTLDLCEMARYSPITQISEQGIFDKAKGVINDIEDEI